LKKTSNCRKNFTLRIGKCGLQKRFGDFLSNSWDIRTRRWAIAQGLDFFEEYNRLEKELHAAYPENVDFKNFWRFLRKTRRYAHGNGQFAQGLDFEERSRLEKELHAAYPENVSFKNGLAISYSKLGETHTAMGNLPKALTLKNCPSYLKNLTLRIARENVDFRKRFGDSCSNLGRLYRYEMNESEKAETLL
jgi:hypothetical protein